MEKLKVGDKVRIKNVELEKQESTGIFFNPEMKDYRGKEAIILKIKKSGRIKLDIDKEYWNWHPNWLELIKEPEERYYRLLTSEGQPNRVKGYIYPSSHIAESEVYPVSRMVKAFKRKWQEVTKAQYEKQELKLKAEKAVRETQQKIEWFHKDVKNYLAGKSSEFQKLVEKELRKIEERETKSEKPIDKVTTDNLDLALRMCNIQLSTDIIDKIIDLVELIEDKGDEVTMKDVCQLQSEWEDK